MKPRYNREPVFKLPLVEILLFISHNKKFCSICQKIFFYYLKPRALIILRLIYQHRVIFTSVLDNAILLLLKNFSNRFMIVLPSNRLFIYIFKHTGIRNSQFHFPKYLGKECIKVKNLKRNRALSLRHISCILSNTISDIIPQRNVIGKY